MQKLLPRAAHFLDTAAGPLRLLSSRHIPAPRVAGPPLSAGPVSNASGLRCPPWLRYDGARTGLCSVQAAKRDGDAEYERKKVGGRDGSRAMQEKRHRGGSDEPTGSGELLAIPGVGPRNLRKLMDKGFDGVARLKQLYRDKVCVHELFSIVYSVLLFGEA